MYNRIIFFINCFGQLQKVNRKINVKHWEKDKLDTEYVIRKVCVYMHVFIYACIFSVEI